MPNQNSFDVIIIGGSYSGLAAGMALGRALRKVLIIDNGKPCNQQTPHSHNFLTNDGKPPADIAATAIQQVRQYDTVEFFTGTVVKGTRSAEQFEITVESGELFLAKKLIFASGIKDRLPDIEGIEACWGISVIHCPYCHGYEVRNSKTGILNNGDFGFEFARMIFNWSKDLTLYTNGPSALSDPQRDKLEQHHIKIIEKEISKLEHIDGHIRSIVFKDGTKASIETLYAPAPFEQHCKIPEMMGCALTEEGYIKVNDMYETTVEGVFAVGDMATKMRTVASAVSTGTGAGMMLNKKMIQEEF